MIRTSVSSVSEVTIFDKAYWAEQLVMGKTRAHVGVYNVFKCQFCGRTNDDCGDWFWVTTKSDVCSICASEQRVKICRGKYLRPAANKDGDGKSLEDIKRAVERKRRSVARKRQKAKESTRVEIE